MLIISQRISWVVIEQGRNSTVDLSRLLYGIEKIFLTAYPYQTRLLNIPEKVDIEKR